MGNFDEGKPIRVGSRKSELALIQTKHVIGLLQRQYKNKKFEIHTMSTMGDRVLNVSLPKIGEKSLFTKDLEDALRNGGVDFVVHSLKDLPTALPMGMAIGAVLEREDARDALVLKESLKNHTLKTLPKGCVIGTSSLRRTAQLRRQYPHLTVCDIRGNLNTRLAKLDAPDSKFSGIILAQAGLVRMGWMSRITQVLDTDDVLYAVGQGALAVECRANDTEILEMLRSLNCLQTTCRILAERSFLKTLGGGCSAPVAVVSKLNGCTKDLDFENNYQDANLALEGAVWSLNGETEIRDQLFCDLKIAPDPNNKKRQTPPQGAGDGNNGNNNNNVNETPPPEKRARQQQTENNTETISVERSSPPVICDDPVQVMPDKYDLKQLIEKHIGIVKMSNEQDNNNMTAAAARLSGGGDADCIASTSSSKEHCPLHIDIGQDVMGQCPFASEVAVAVGLMTSAGECPIAIRNNNNEKTATKFSLTTTVGSNDQVDRATVAAASKCPFAAIHDKSMESIAKSSTGHQNQSCGGDNVANKPSVSGIHTKCPFIQKTVELFDYRDDQKPKANDVNILIEESIDELFCGLYQHKCFNRELYVKANKLGQQLANNLIKMGALDVMHVAQAEIHSKIP